MGNGTPINAKVKLQPLGLWWYGGIAFVALCAIAGGWLFDDSTELAPGHDRTGDLCLAAGCVAGLVSMIVALFQYRGGLLLKIWGMLCFGFIGGLAVVLLGQTVSDVVWANRDSPAGHTQAFQSQLRISGATRSHSLRWGTTRYVQLASYDPDLGIGRQDYDFMLAHRRPGDRGSNADEISSKGYFCAQVTLQKSGAALRVLHAGRQPLPDGSVVICPADPSRSR